MKSTTYLLYIFAIFFLPIFFNSKILIWRETIKTSGIALSMVREVQWIWSNWNGSSNYQLTLRHDATCSIFNNRFMYHVLHVLSLMWVTDNSMFNMFTYKWCIISNNAM